MLVSKWLCHLHQKNISRVINIHYTPFVEDMPPRDFDELVEGLDRTNGLAKVDIRFQLKAEDRRRPLSIKENRDATHIGSSTCREADETDQGS
jgi:hypothetical protein